MEVKTCLLIPQNGPKQSTVPNNKFTILGKVLQTALIWLSLTSNYGNHVHEKLLDSNWIRSVQLPCSSV